MSSLLWLVLITAFMFFMHRGHGSHGGGMGCCGGGHAHGGHDRDHSSHDHEGDWHRSQKDIAAIPEAEFEEVEERSVAEIEPAKESDMPRNSARAQNTNTMPDELSV